MKRFLVLFAAFMAVSLLTVPAAVYAQHDDPNMEWEDTAETAVASVAKESAPEVPKTLYDRWGGNTAIKGVVSELAIRVLADERINARFTGSDVAQWKQTLVGQLTEAAGGPKYTGKDLKKTLQENMEFTEADFQALTEQLNRALDWFNFRPTDKDQLLTALDLKKSETVSTSGGTRE